MTESNSQQIKRDLYLRMLLFALIGFGLFFGGAWLRLRQIGAFHYGPNPYAGPPPLLTCLISGGVGLVLGAIVGILKRNKT